MLDKEEKIAKLRNKISYWTEQLKVVKDQKERGLISDKILEARKEIGVLNSKALDRIRKVDIIDATPVADRFENKTRSIISFNSKDRVKFRV